MKTKVEKRKLTRAAHAFVILSVAFSILFVAVLFGNCFLWAFSTNTFDGEVFVGTMQAFFVAFVEGFIYPFTQEGLVAFPSYVQSINAALDPMVMSIVMYAICGAALLGILIMIPVVCHHKRPKYVWFTLGLLFFAGALCLLASSQLAWSWNIIAQFFANPEILQNNWLGIGMFALAILSVLFAALVLIFTIVAYVLVLIDACKKQEEQVEEAIIIENIEEPALAEEELIPEAVVALDEEPGEEPEAMMEMEEEPIQEDYASEFIPVIEPEPEPDPIEVEEEPEEPVQERPQVEVNVGPQPQPQPQPAFDPNSLAAMLREVVRDIVRDEIARNAAKEEPKPEEPKGPQTITGATFGGPLVVQYFNGGINGVNPAQPVAQPEPVAQPQPQPAPAPEAKPEPAPAPEVKPEPAPAPVAQVEPEKPAEEKPAYERLSFAERLLQSDKELHDLYNELKNEILSYGVKSRVSAVGDTFRLHKKMYVRITVAGKSLKLYFALNPDDYRDSKVPVQDAGNKGMYADIPLVFKVRSGLSVRRCKELIQDCMDKDGLTQGEVGKVNWIKELKAELKAQKAGKNADED